MWTRLFGSDGSNRVNGVTTPRVAESRGGTENKTVAANTGSIASNSTPSVGSLTNAINNKSGVAFKKLSDKDMARKRERGLCFKCDEKFGLNHQCKNKQFQVMVLKTIEDDAEWNGEIDVSEDEVEPQVTMELSMSIVVGLLSNDAMKVMGQINGKEVIILIDNEASHNFYLTGDREGAISDHQESPSI